MYPRIFKGFNDDEIKEEMNPFVGAQHTSDLVHAQYIAVRSIYIYIYI